jgi:hypothetical protein
LPFGPITDNIDFFRVLIWFRIPVKIDGFSGAGSAMHVSTFFTEDGLVHG